MTLSAKLSDFRHRFQGELFPSLAEEVGPLLGTHHRFVAAPDLVGVEGFVGSPGGGPGRPPEDRRALARAFPARAVRDLPTTRHLIDRLGAIPGEATFSRAFAAFAEARLAERMHEALVVDAPGETLVGHVSRDATAIEGREAAVAKVKVKKPRRRPGRPRKGEERPKTPSRLKRQAGGMSLEAMPADIPKVCDRGTKKNARGIRETWRGCRLHVDTADCGVPLGAILTSASLHDSRVANLHDLMDSACDATEIHTVSERLGPVPMIATNPRRDKALKDDLNREARARRTAGHPDAQTVRYRVRPVVERTRCQAQGRVRRPSCPRAGPHESHLPSDVRLARTHSRSDHPPRRAHGAGQPDPLIPRCAPQRARPQNARLKTRQRPRADPVRYSRCSQNLPRRPNRSHDCCRHHSGRQFCKRLVLVKRFMRISLSSVIACAEIDPGRGTAGAAQARVSPPQDGLWQAVVVSANAGNAASQGAVSTHCLTRGRLATTGRRVCFSFPLDVIGKNRCGVTGARLQAMEGVRMARHVPTAARGPQGHIEAMDQITVTIDQSEKEPGTGGGARRMSGSFLKQQRSTDTSREV